MEKLKKLKNLTAFAPFLSALILGACAAAALQGHEAAAYEEAAPKAVMEETGDTTDQDSGQDAGTDAVNDSGTVDLSKIADGTYEGEGTGFGGKIRVSVKMKDHKITSIQIISASGEDVSFFDRAKAVIDRILAAQSLEVDTVSGATYSSRGIIRAVKNALSGETDDGKTVGSSSDT